MCVCIQEGDDNAWVRKNVYTIGPGLLHVYVGDITNAAVDVIVNAANKHLNHCGGVAGAIAKAAGDEVKKESQQYIRNHGELLDTCNIFTNSGKLLCKKILHAVGPRWVEFAAKNKTNQLENALKQTFLNCLISVCDAGYATMAIPGIGSGNRFCFNLN